MILWEKCVGRFGSLKTQTPAKLGKISKTFPKMDEKGMLKSFVRETAKLKPKVAECSSKTQKFAENALRAEG